MSRPTVVRSLDPEQFFNEYLAPGRPVLVRGALNGWRVAPPWSLAELTRRFGDHDVPLFDTLFSLEEICTFADYVAAHTGSRASAIPPYLRWFTRQEHKQQLCADEVFATLADDWAVPSWLPAEDYILPHRQGAVDATRDAFPAKGLFICGAGGRTRLHVDPWASDACLCQVTGTKRFIMFPPDAASLLSDGAGNTVDLDQSDDVRFPRWAEAVPALDEVLSPGDAIYIPAGWYHTAIALTDSVSITWNFIHRVHEERFEAYLESGGSADPVISYFRDIAPGA